MLGTEFLEQSWGSTAGSWDPVELHPGSGQAVFTGRDMKLPPRGAVRKK